MSPALEMAKETPLVVRCLAQAMYASSCRNGADPQLLQILNRTTSERMKKVWSELLKRKRVDYSPTNDFVHAVSAPGPHTSWTPQARSWRRRADELRKLGGSHLSEAARLEIYATFAEAKAKLLLSERLGHKDFPPQELALACFFDQLVNLAVSQPKPVSRPEARVVRNRYLEMAKQIRADAADEGGYVDPRLWAAAYAYEGLADQQAPPAASPFLVEREPRGDPTLKGFVIALSDVTHGIFKKRLVGTVATVTSVLFGRDVTEARLRKMLRATPR
jgi:hypothetical protein